LGLSSIQSPNIYIDIMNTFDYIMNNTEGEFEEYYRFRIGNYRLFYIVDKQKVIVFILEIANRKDADS